MNVWPSRVFILIIVTNMGLLDNNMISKMEFQMNGSFVINKILKVQII